MVTISVIIPVFNTPDNFLISCLESIKRQTFLDFEAVIIDDGSKKNTAELLDLFAEKDKRFRIFHKKNEGVSIARNMGIFEAKGKFITFVDSDDFIEPNMLQRLMELQSEYDADIVMCHHDRVINGRNVEVKYVGPDLKVCHRADRTMIQEMLLSPLAYENKYVWHTLVCTIGKLYKTSMIKKIEFPKDVGNGEDAIWGFKIVEKMNVMVVVNEPLYHYVQWEGSAAHKYDPRVLESWEKNRKAIRTILESEDYSEKIWSAYHRQGLEVIKLLLFTIFAHPDNKGELGKRDLMELAKSDAFRESLKKLKVMSQHDNKTKLVLLLLKMRCYGILIRLTSFRLKQVERT